jgi:aspartate/glutamate racemase
MSDFATSLRVISAYKAGEDLADRLATAITVQQSMSVALRKAADEIERMRLTDAERQAVSSAIAAEQERGDWQSADTLRFLQERLK